MGDTQQLFASEFLQGAKKVAYNLGVEALVEEAIKNGEGELSDTGALSVRTGKHTGRSPKDKFIVDTPTTHDVISWTNNAPCTEETFNSLYAKMKEFSQEHQLYVTDAYVGADEETTLQLKVITEYAWHQLFGKQLFIRPATIPTTPEGFTVIYMPSVKADPEKDHTHSETFIILNFDKKIVLIGGGEYAGEMKKSIFSVMNYLLPHKGILSMHCSANIGKDGNTAVFFGLSGTGKTTLSADPNRSLIGDDEHGWNDNGIFNIEGGCYAKVIDITDESEPEIYNAVKFGAVLENVVLDPITRKPDYFDARYTKNTRTAYPVDYIPNAAYPSKGKHPKAIIFLTADAYGVLPPISKLTKEEAMYHFLSGYTSKVAGTERGVTEPQPTFSIGFGEPFLPLPPLQYARLLGKKIDQYGTKVYLLNTGWTGGQCGQGGHRMKLSYTRAMVTAILDGALDNVEWVQDPLFKVYIPSTCPNVPADILQPVNTWSDKEAYKLQALKLVKAFQQNVKKFEGEMSEDILNAGPQA
jgi:phosphoenolpyruvate carboxykinase (ATP)